jgi:hypothetical protein
MRKRYLLFIASTVFCATISTKAVKAQSDHSVSTATATTTDVQTTSTTVTTTTTTEQSDRPASIGLTLGTPGIGLEASIPLDKNFCLRPGIGYIPKFNYTYNAVLGQYSVSNKFKTELLHIQLLADYYLPVLHKAGFRVTAGIAGFLIAKSEAVTVPTGALYYGDIPINDDPARMGEVKSKVTRNGVAAYVGAGFQDLVNGKHFGLSLDLGTYYSLVDPTVEMTTTGYLVGNERNAKQLKDNLSSYRWLPTLQIGLHYKL